MENLVPRDQIPQSWLEKSRCPYCSSAPLIIEHQPESPDHFVCPTCEMAFRVAKNESSIYVLHDPVGVSTGFVGQWVEMKTLISSTREIPKAEKQEQKPIKKQSVVSPAEGTTSDKRDSIYNKYPAEVIENAADLFEYGTSKQQIKETLNKYSELAEEEIDEIIDFISKRKVKQVAPTVSMPRWALGCIIVPFICLLAYGLIVYIQYRTASSFTAGDDPRSVSVMKYENLPEAIQNMIPPEVQEISMPVPLIEKLNVTGAEINPCPTDTDTAAVLYGGTPGEWDYNAQQKIWTLQAVVAETITVPEGHLGVIPYLNEGLSIQLMPGPVQISNAYLLVVRCP
ncbi:MAG: hypothetical protein JEZ00_10180 [Anaerolineaceae bacterium]|nr:hypothetical protein [Anaerolineaceae bacterium]